MRHFGLESVAFAIVAISVTICIISISVMNGRSTSRFAVHLARKRQEDTFWLETDKSELWYQVNLTTNLEKNPEIIEKFVQMSEDEATSEFIVKSVDQSDSWFLQSWHSVAKFCLGFFYTQTDINGFLDRGSMFVLSQGTVVS
jgi:hypothetical protein